VVRGGGSPGATKKDAGSDVSPVEASKRKIRGLALGDGEGVDDDDADADDDNDTGARKKLPT
jgi:hypothetical protein